MFVVSFQNKLKMFLREAFLTKSGKTLDWVQSGNDTISRTVMEVVDYEKDAGVIGLESEAQQYVH